jgi:DNA polymerase IV
VLSASPEALAAGVVVGMPVRDALRVCPAAALRQTRMPRYRAAGDELRAVVRELCDRFEPAGLGDLYIDPSRSQEPGELAAELCVRIQAELGLVAVAGVGPTRFVACLAAQSAGELRIRTVQRSEVLGFLAEHPVSVLPGVGPAAAYKLGEHRIRYVGDLQDRSLEELAAILGSRSVRSVLDHATGRDPAHIRPTPPVKSLSKEHTLICPSADVAALSDVIAELAAGVELVLQRERRAAATVSLGVGYADGERCTRSLTRERALTQRADIEEIALELLGRTEITQRPVRRIRLKVSRLSRRPGGPDPRQLRLF